MIAMKYGPLGMLALAGMLAGCGDPTPPTDAEISAAAAKLPKQKPGRYTMTTRLVDYDLPGASPQEADTARSQLGSLIPQTMTACLGERDVDLAFKDTLNEMKAGKCTIDRFEVDGSELDAAATCTTVHGVISKVGVVGTSSAESTRSTITLDQQNPKIPGGKVTMVLESESRRQGDC